MTDVGNINETDAFKSSFFNAEAVGDKKIPLTITAVTQEEFQTDTGTEKKIVVHFAEDERRLSLNRTNKEILVSMFGVLTKDWINQPVTLLTEGCQLPGGKRGRGVRVADAIPV